MCTKKPIKCLFCKAHAAFSNPTSVEPESITVSRINGAGDAESVAVKGESKGFIVPPTHDEFHLEGQLKAIFVLRKLLDLSEEECVEYLKRNDGNHNPSGWFTLCSTCNDVVRDCYLIYQEVQRCCRKLERRKMLLQSKLNGSSGKKWEGVGSCSQYLNSFFCLSSGCPPEPASLEDEEVGSTESSRRRSSRIRKKRTYVDHSLMHPDDGSDDFSEPQADKFPEIRDDDVDSICSRGSDDDWEPSNASVEFADTKHGDSPNESSEDVNKDPHNINEEAETTLPASKRHRCKECVAAYDTTRPLKLHSKLHELPPEVRGTCKCGWVFPSSKIPRRHKKYCTAITTRTAKYKCPLCPAGYQWESAFLRHSVVHQSKEDTISCEKCGWVFERNSIKYKRHLNDHFTIDYTSPFVKRKYTRKKDPTNVTTLTQEANNQGEVLNCSSSPKFPVGEKTKSLKIQHASPPCSAKQVKVNPEDDIDDNDDAADEVPYYCDHCHFIFTSKSGFTTHFRNHRKDKIPLLECDICQATKFESKQLLQMHCTAVHGTTPANETDSKLLDDNVGSTTIASSSAFTCSYCPDSFPTKMKRDYHLAKHHREEFLTCPTCKNFTGTSYYILKQHMIIHDPDFKTVCAFCSKMINKTSIRTHNQLFHYAELGLKPIQCEKCKMIFTSEKRLRQHMDFVHNNNEASSCPFCLKKFKWMPDLENHIKSHSEPKQHKYKKGPFFCKICQAKFNVRQALYYHMKRLHSDKYSFRCEKCGKGYCFENTLLDHQKSCNVQNEQNEINE